MVFGFLTSLLGNWKMIMIGAVAIMIAGFVAYYYYSQNRIESYAQEVVQLERQNETQKRIIENLEKDIEDIQAANRRLLERERSFQKNLDRLNERLEGLESSARENPGATQERINQEERFRTRCLEIATGSKPTENDVDNNFVCPDLIEERYSE